MKYRNDIHGNQVSVLGFGCMRFTSTAGRIDIEKAKSEIKAAIDGGINYYDTAYIYTGSEAALGVIFEDLGVRRNIKIATKLPHYLVKKKEDLDRYFEEQLSRLKTDYIDYYLIHMLTDVKAWDRLCSLGIKEWIQKQKESGRIKQIGFSYHGGTEMFCSICDVYDWEFCQIEYNYQDEHSQAGISGLKYAASKGLPIIIMEPLRGGRLANKLPEEALDIFEKYPVKRSPAQWAFRWLYNQPEVTCVLSGMNSIEMVEDNIETADSINTGDLTADELQVYEDVVKAIKKKVKIPCTGCRYCMPCPRNVDIPGCFSAYNNGAAQGLYVGLKEYFQCVVLRQNYAGVSNCIGCGKCEKHCPQGIKIREEIKRIRHRYENPALKAVIKLAPKFVKY